MRTSFLPLLTATALLLSRGSTPGAETAKPTAPPPATETSVVSAPDGRRIFHLDIIDGRFEPQPGVKKPANLGNLMDFVRANLPGVNIVLSPGTAEIMVQDLRLRSAEFGDLLQALTVATGNNVAWRQDAQVYSLISRASGERRVEVFNLTHYIDARASAAKPANQEELNRIVQGVYEMIHDSVAFANDRGPDQKVDLRFHPEARLLVVRGSPKAVEVVRKVVAALNEPYQNKPAVRPDLIDLE